MESGFLVEMLSKECGKSGLPGSPVMKTWHSTARQAQVQSLVEKVCLRELGPGKARMEAIVSLS